MAFTAHFYFNIFTRNFYMDVQVRCSLYVRVLFLTPAVHEDTIAHKCSFNFVEAAADNVTLSIRCTT